MTDEKKKMLEAAIAQIEKQYGKGSIMRLGTESVLVPVSVIPTGSISLDARAGRGRSAARPRDRNLRPGIGRQDDHDAARHRRGAEDRRPGGVH